MATSKWRGHKIFWSDGLWCYSDNLQPVRNDKNRACRKCKKENTPEGHDGCLGTLPGVMNACCGHGRKKDAYVQLINGQTIHGKDAKTILDILKKQEIYNEN